MILSHFHGDRSARVPARPATQRGESLVEVLVTVVLMGIGFTAIFGAIFTVAKVTTMNQRRTQASSGVQSWAEGLQQPATQLENVADPRAFYSYRPCATPGAYGRVQLPSGAIPTNWRPRAEVTKVELLRDFAGGKPNFDLSVADCYGLGGDRGLQRITIKIESNDEPRVVDTLVVIKRDARCPVGFENADLGPC